jgi:hypothetical protein
MKYLLLIYGNPEQWEHPLFERDPRFLAFPADVRAELTEQAGAMNREIVESGELVGGVALGHPGTAATVRVRKGARLVTDGPYAEAKEHLAGFMLLDCASPERAVEIASRVPDAHFTAVELRPLTECRPDAAGGSRPAGGSRQDGHGGHSGPDGHSRPEGE